MSDQRLVCPHSLNHTTSCGSGAHNDELIFLLGKEKKKRIVIVFQSSMSIYHQDAFLLLFLIMKLLSICTMKRAWLGTSALCEGDETKMGPWESLLWSASDWRNSFPTFHSIRERKGAGCEIKCVQISSYFVLAADICICICNILKSWLLLTKVISHRRLAGDMEIHMAYKKSLEILDNI